MATLVIYAKDGSEAGQREVDVDQLADSINMQLLHDAVVMYQANRRSGSHKTKTRGEVAGSTRKMYRQKGTGNARAGSRRSGIRRGGGHIFALRPRDYSYRLPKKALRRAAAMALRGKIEDGELVLIESWELEAPKTREVASVLARLPRAGESTLVVTEEAETIVYRSARNIPGVSVQPADEVHAESLLCPARVVATAGAFDRLWGRLARTAAVAAAE